MDKATALSRMKLPSHRREGKWRDGVLQVRVTGACDRSCPHCTQGSNLRGMAHPMTPELFEKALQSLEGYWGVIGIFGGNPCTHPDFPELCRILRNYFPKEQCGLWSNRLFGHGTVCRETFNPGHSNLNVHGSAAAFEEIKRTWPESHPIGLDKPSRHPPILTALQDLVPKEEDRWELIANCDINQHWSAIISVFDGELRGYFCEVASTIALLHKKDIGLPVYPGWWKAGWDVFGDQAQWACHKCGVPIRGRGKLDSEDKEQVTVTHSLEVAAATKTRTRSVQVISKLSDLEGHVDMTTLYIQNGEKQ